MTKIFKKKSIVLTQKIKLEVISNVTVMKCFLGTLPMTTSRGDRGQGAAQFGYECMEADYVFYTLYLVALA